jgi:hypothetical protein
MKVGDRQSKHSPYFIDEKKPSRFFAVVAEHLVRVEKFDGRKEGPVRGALYLYGTFFIYHIYEHFARILDACLHAELAFRFALLCTG